MRRGDRLGAARARPPRPARAGRRARPRCRRSGSAPRAGRGDEADAQRAPHREVVAEAARQHQLARPSRRHAGHVLEHGRRPEAMAPLQSCTCRTSSWVRAISRSAPRLAGPREDDEPLLAAHQHARAQGRGEPVAAVHVDEAGPVDDARVEQRGDRRRRGPSRRGPGRRASPMVCRRRSPSSTLDAVDGAHAPRACRGGSARPRARGRRAPSRPRGARASRAGPRRWCRCRRRCGSRGDSSMRVASATATASAPTKPATMRQEADARLGIDLEEELARGQGQRVAHHRGVGREAHVGRVDAQEQVVHAGVADDHDLVDPLGEHARLAA